MKLIDLTGSVFGEWVVLGRDKNYQGRMVKWMCVCECGKTKSVYGSSLRSETSKSCGCLRKKLGLPAYVKHGHSNTKTYYSWAGAKSRCLNPKDASYKYYGGRGITICERWFSDFRLFLEDMGEKPEGFSLERKDVNGNYEPGNCKWILKSKQALNRRNTVFATYNGKTKPLSEWAKDFKVIHGSLHSSVFEASKNNEIKWLGTSVLESGQNYTWRQVSV